MFSSPSSALPLFLSRSSGLRRGSGERQAGQVVGAVGGRWLVFRWRRRQLGEVRSGAPMAMAAARGGREEAGLYGAPARLYHAAVGRWAAAAHRQEEEDGEEKNRVFLGAKTPK
jgi:hypothetical protein